MTKDIVKAQNAQTPDLSKQLIADSEETPVVLADVLADMGMGGPRVPAKDLIGHTLTIYRAKPFLSSYADDKEAWFVICLDHESRAQITTVLGGGAVVDILSAYASTGQNKPLMVVLNWIEGGRFGGYYQLG